MSGCATGGAIWAKGNSFFFHFLSFLSYFSFSYMLQMIGIHDISIIKVMITTLYFFIFIYFSCLVVGIELACSCGTHFLPSYCIYISKHDHLILPIITARFLNLILHLQLFGLLIFGTFFYIFIFSIYACQDAAFL